MAKLRPFIHPIKTFKGNYFYDVNRNEIIKISEESYQILKEGIKKDGIIGDETQEIRDLIGHGYLSDKRVEKIEHQETENVEYYLDRKLGQLILQVTQGCNLKCSYCAFASNNYKHFRSHSGKSMSWDTAKLAIDYYFKHSMDSDYHNINFYGGEPLLAQELLERIVTYVKTEYPYHDVSYYMTTNATLLKDKRLEFCVENNIHVTISLDGPKKVHDLNRRFLSDGKGSYDVIIENLMNIKEKYPEFYKTIRYNMVLDPLNGYEAVATGMNEDDTLSELDGTGGLIDERGATSKTTVPEKFTIEHTYSIFLAFLQKNNIVQFSKEQKLLTRDLDAYDKLKKLLIPTPSLPDTASPSGPCIPGRSKWFVRYDGEFFPCEKVSELSEFLDVGNIKDGIRVDSVKNLLNISKISGNRCSDCWAFRFCDHCAAIYDNGGRASQVLNASQCVGTLNQKETELRVEILERELKSCE